MFFVLRILQYSFEIAIDDLIVILFEPSHSGVTRFKQNTKKSINAQKI